MSATKTDVIDIVRFHSTDTHLVDQMYEGWAEAFRHDQPDEPVLDRAGIEAMLANSPHGWNGEYYAAIVDGRFAGIGLMFMPQLDNTHLAILDIVVYLDHRRRGIGRTLFEHIVKRGAELGRTTFQSRVKERPTDQQSPGPAYATAMGMTSAMTEVTRRLTLSTMDHGAFATMLADCWERAAGYETVQWLDGVDGPAPEEYVDDLARLQVRLDTDAPKGDLNFEPREPNPDDVRANTTRNGTAGIRLMHTGVRHVASGRIVAWSTIFIFPSDRGYGLQGITVVDPDHRGLRLGTLVKLENLTYARKVEPTLRLVETSNAGENRHMIAINETLGFTVSGRVHNFQKEI